MKKIYLLNLLVIFAFILKAQDYKISEKNLHLKRIPNLEKQMQEKEMYLQEIEQKKNTFSRNKKTKSYLK